MGGTRLVEREAAAGRPLPRDEAGPAGLNRSHTDAGIDAVDGWKTPVHIRQHGFRMEIGSAAPDGIRGTACDLVGPPLRRARYCAGVAPAAGATLLRHLDASCILPAAQPRNDLCFCPGTYP